jgi:hypothetical protein
VIAIALAGLSAAIVVATARGFHAKTFLGVSMLIALAFWVIGQGLGGVFTGQATDVNTGPLLILLAALTWQGLRIREHRPARAIQNTRQHVEQVPPTQDGA